VKEVDCGAVVTFESFLVVSFDGNSSKATPAQVAALEQGVVETFNTLNGLNRETCDLSFRRLTDAMAVAVNVTSGSNRRSLQGVQRIVTRAPTRKPTQRGGVFSYRFRVIGTCRGCSSSARLFDDAIRRRLALPSSFNIHDGGERREQVSGTTDTNCFCPILAENRGPTIGEFETSFEMIIQSLLTDGLLTSFHF